MIKVGMVSAVLAAATYSTKADFVVTGYLYPGSTNDVYEIYAFDNGANGTGTRAVSDDVTLRDFNPIAGVPPRGFVFKFVDNTDFAPADLTGVALYNANGHNPAVLFGGNQDRSFINLLGDTSTADPTLYNVTLTVPDNEFGLDYHFGHITQWEQAGTVPGGVDASAAANGGRGALIAVAVIPHGELVEATGIVQGSTGPGTVFTWPIPEPGSFALLAIGFGPIVLRRRRR